MLAASQLLPESPEPATKEAPQFTDESAKGACRMFIERTLHDPDSAVFGDTAEALVRKESSGIWVVQRDVRAKNAFNATRRAVFECRMMESGDSWRPLSVKQLP